MLTLVGRPDHVPRSRASSDDQKKIFGPLTIVGLAVALGAAVAAGGEPGAAFHDMLVVDGFATFFRVLVIGVGMLAVFSSIEYLEREKSNGGEYYALILFSIVGQSVMVTANELIMVFIGLEISSIASYVLAGYLRDDSRNNESALKYFLLGSFATAFLLYGVAWIYGLTGSTNLFLIRQALASGAAPPLALTGVAAALMFVGLRLQDFRRALSGLGPGRLSGRARPDLGIPLRGTEGRGIRDSGARIHDGLWTDRRALGTHRLGLRARHHDRRQFRRDPAVQYQAHAGI